MSVLAFAPGPPDDATLHRLAEPDGGRRHTVSMYLKTDARVPANAAHTPAWLVTARNGLRDVTEALEGGEDREAKLRWREARARVEETLDNLAPADRGRSLVWFLDVEGRLDERYVLQVPVRDSMVALADRPVIAPLIEVLDHSRPIGVVLVSGERVRLVHWAHGRIDEAGEEVFDRGEDGWRPYRGPASGSRAGGGRTGTTHVEQVESRMEEHRERFFAEAARATARRLEELGWERVVIAAEKPMVARFRHHLPEAVTTRVVAELPLNAVDAHESEIAERLEPAIEDLHRRDALAAVHALEGNDDAAIGPAAVLAALAQRQVEHLVLDPYHRPAESPLPAVAETILDGAPMQRLPERAVEAAIAADARVTTLEAGASPALQAADGMLAGLRW